MVKRKKYSTSYLYPKPTMILGIGSVLNIVGNHYRFRYSNSAMQSDFEAIENDWGMVGNDIIEASNKLKKEL